MMNKVHIMILLGLSVGLLSCDVQSESALSQENTALSDQLEALNADLKVQENVNTELQATLEEVVTERDTVLEAVAEIEAVSAQRDEAQAQVANLQDQLALLQTELQETKDRETQLGKSMNATLNEFDAVRQELEGLKGQVMGSSVDESLIETLQLEHKAANSQLDVLNAEYLALQEENKLLRDQLEDSESDTDEVAANKNKTR